ncbi:MAG: hypothetical protein IJF27_09005 [Oscillospiraceae bacterium]|nr:hypothetical protein [Oscillospiraceae bacterium]
MKKLYEKYKKLNIDHAAIGLEMSSEESTYFCTPKGAKIIGWAGVDGIHFCFVRGLGETVFAVNPMSAYNDDYVNPVANSFEDFLKLLLTCGDVSAIEQAHFLTKEQFESFLEENKLYNKQREILKVIEKELKIQPMEAPYDYIREIQRNFDYSKIKYSMEYCLWAPPRADYSAWKVYFGECFYSKNRSRPGKELAIDKSLVWGGEEWRVPSVYLCAKGLVADVCVKIQRDKICSFNEKWHLNGDSATAVYGEEEHQLMAQEDPLNINVNAELTVNGKKILTESGCTEIWNPCLPDGCINDRSTEAILQHYGCDPHCGWVFIRMSFPWATARKPKINSMSLKLVGESSKISAGSISLKNGGDKAAVIHPVSGEKYTLTALDITDDEMHTENPAEIFGENMEYPTHYKRMVYSVSPEIGDNVLMVEDAQPSDQPRCRKKALYLPTATNSTVIAIIGGADGPTAVTFGVERGKFHAACSGMRFEPAERVEWKASFLVNLRGQTEIKLI